MIELQSPFAISKGLLFTTFFSPFTVSLKTNHLISPFLSRNCETRSIIVKPVSLEELRFSKMYGLGIGNEITSS